VRQRAIATLVAGFPKDGGAGADFARGAELSSTAGETRTKASIEEKRQQCLADCPQPDPLPNTELFVTFVFPFPGPQEPGGEPCLTSQSNCVAVRVSLNGGFEGGQGTTGHLSFIAPNLLPEGRPGTTGTITRSFRGLREGRWTVQSVYFSRRDDCPTEVHPPVRDQLTINIVGRSPGSPSCRTVQR